ncbi:MAG: thioredoxin domain-containing protein [Elusimicrobiota bacterium]
MNRLSLEKSPYLLQHQANPVDWRPWGDEAFALAKAEDKPVFLSIGYSACHWCHVMERESFADLAVAAELNKRFVCVKVDREERPEVDRFYMTALHALGRQGGWPLTMWLTPDRKPFFGATYMPPDNLKAVAESVETLWKTRRAELEASAAAVLGHLAGLSGGWGEGAPAGLKVLDHAFDRMRGDFDPEYGGFGGAPKFPQPATLAFLLRYSDRTGDSRGTAMAVKTLRAMADGGIHDQVGGGFHRYSTDETWLVPHFEKMLYDNALLLRVYTEAHQVTGAQDMADTARSIAGYMLRDLRLPGGGFASGEDADSAGVEGKFYVWTPDEVAAVLEGRDCDVFCWLYDITEGGNWQSAEGGPAGNRSIPRRVRSLAEVAEEFGLSASEVQRIADQGLAALLEERSKRERPLKDDKVLASWNGLAIASLAYAGRVLEEPSWVEAAETAAWFVLTRLFKDGRLLRRWRDGESRFPGGLEDYAFLADGLIDLYEATFKPRYLTRARDLAVRMKALFEDERGGFYSTGQDEKDVPLRLKDTGDAALPSGNAAAARCLIRLSEFYGERAWSESAEKTVRAFSGLLRQSPEALPCMLAVVDLLAGPRDHLIVAGDGPVTHAAAARFLPRAALASAGSCLPMTLGAAQVKGRSLVYVCRGKTCLPPASTVEELDEELART